MPPVVQIVPRLPPAVCGVGDYALRLAGALAGQGVETGFVSAAGGADTSAPWDIRNLPSRTAASLCHALDQSGAGVVLLQFSGYGYADRGLCWWLPAGLRQWRGGGGKRRVVTVFHELYATGPIWRSSFWTAWPQRNIARAIAGLSDAVFVTSQAGQETLARLRPDLGATVLPVFSNIGELPDPAPLHLRGDAAIVFGSAGPRRRAYEALAPLGPEFGQSLRRMGVARIIDIGGGAMAPQQLGSLPVEPRGILPAPEVSDLLAQARVGLLAYSSHVITKSGIFAAYLAHGVLAVKAPMGGALPSDLRAGREFARPQDIAAPGFDPEAVARTGHRWYQARGLEQTAAQIARSLP